jgi:hypothetical protein
MRWWRRVRANRVFPRVTVNGWTADPVAPAALGRALVKASRLDARNHARFPRGVRSTALIEGLSEEDRRRIGLRIQLERTGLAFHDIEQPVMQALCATHCGWRPAETHQLFALALEGVDPVHPAAHIVPESVQLPLAAFEELDPADRGSFEPYLRTLLAVCLGCRAADTRNGLAWRVRALLPAVPLDPLLPPIPDGFLASARCGLGATLYEEPVLRLLRLCMRLETARPTPEWRGSMRELLSVGVTARDAVGTLLAAGRGAPDDCRWRDDRHLEPLSSTSDALLAALAWAAPLTGAPHTMTQLDRTLAFHLRAASHERLSGSGRFVRAALSVLRTYERKPGTGAEFVAVRDLLDSFGPPGRSVRVGDYTAVFQISSRGTPALRFRPSHSDSRGFLKDVPADVRRYFPGLYAALRLHLADLRTHLDAHLVTLAELLEADPGTSAARWYAVHLDDPCLRPLSRALIWQADTPTGSVTGLPLRRRRSGSWMLRALDGRLHELTDDTTVRLWNPGLSDVQEAAAWRAALTERRISQPVRQV